jgi:hypothetical protein
VLGKIGAGNSPALRFFVDQRLDAKQPVCIIDHAVRLISTDYGHTAKGLLELTHACEQILKDPATAEEGPTLALYAA